MEDISREEELFGSYLISLNKGGKLKTEIEKIDNLGQLQPLPERRFKLFHVPDPNLILPELAGGNNFMLPHISAKLKLANKKNFSDGLVAKKNINQGDVLLLEKAAILPNHPQYEIPAREDIYRCHHCLKAIQYFVTCPGCDVIFFCGYNCRYYSWNEYHRWECFGLQRGFFPKNDIHYVAMRMLFFELQFVEGAISKNYYEKEYNIEHFQNLPYKLDEDKKKLFSFLKNCVEVVVYLLVHTSFFEWIVQFPKYKNKDQFKLYSIIGGSLLKYYYQFQQNSIQIKQVLYHGIPAQNRAEFIADAIFLSTRYFLNDPHPNTDWFVLGNYLVIKAIKDISVGDKITVKWRTDVNDCCCKKCFNAASLNVFKCFHCEKTVKPIEKSDCEFYLNLKYMESISNIEKNIAFICNKCKKISALSEYKEIFVYSQHNIDVYLATHDVDYLDHAKAEYEKIFGKNHIYYIKLYSWYLDYYLRNDKDMPKFIAKASEIMCLIEVHYGKLSQAYVRSLIFLIFRFITYLRSTSEHKHTVIAYCKSLVKDVENVAEFYQMFGAMDPIIKLILFHQGVKNDLIIYKSNKKNEEKKVLK